MLLFTFSSGVTEVHFIGMQKEDFSFNRFDRHAPYDFHYGRTWILESRYLIGRGEWTQVGPLNMVRWSKEDAL